MVCGFCSTGCSLDVHLRDGEAVNLTPTTDYPVNLGMACPKGWEALTPLRRPRPGHHAAAARRRRPAACRSTGRRRSSTFTDALQGDPGRARPRVGRLPLDRADPHRGDGAARRAGQVRHGHGPRRRQHPPVHGHVGRRLQAGVRLRRAAVHLRRLRGVRRHRARRLEPLHRPPDHVGAGHAQPAPARDHRRRSPRAPRRRWPRRSTTPLAPKSDLVAALRPGPPADRARRLDRPRLRRRAHHRLRRRSPRTSTASRPSGWPRRPACRSTQLERFADTIARRASASRSGGRWASTRATRACAPRRRSSTWP